jgi:hypothetical protein
MAKSPEYQQKRQTCWEIPVYGALAVRTTGHDFLGGRVTGEIPARVKHVRDAHLDLHMTRTWPPVGRHATPVLIRAIHVLIPVRTPVKILVLIPARPPVGVPALQPAKIPVTPA